MDWVAAGSGAGGLLVGIGSVVAYVMKKDRRLVEPDRRDGAVVPLNGTKCDGHIDVCKAVAVLPMLEEGLREFRSETRKAVEGITPKMEKDSKRLEDVVSEVFGIIRRHERSIGRLEGMADTADDGTRGHERIRA